MVSEIYNDSHITEASPLHLRPTLSSELQRHLAARALEASNTRELLPGNHETLRRYGLTGAAANLGQSHVTALNQQDAARLFRNGLRYLDGLCCPKHKQLPGRRYLATCVQH
jgi:hypothetical protein